MTSTAADRRVTAVDIAREVGVSRATVGFVLNSTPGQTISETTRSKVLEAAERLGYRPHLAAKALASGRNRIVLLVLPDWPLEYSMRRHIEEATHALDDAGYALVTTTPHPGGLARPLWETLQPDVVVGLLPFSPERYAEIRDAGVTAIIPHPDDAGPVGDQGYDEGPRLQVNHLVDQGRRHLAFASTADPRVAGLVAARHDVSARAARVHGLKDLEMAHVDAENARDVVSAWRRRGIDGVVAYNDDIAALVVGAAVRLGLTVPQDIAVVGHDDSPIAEMLVPSLTTVHVDDKGLGRYLAQQALNAARGAPAPEWEPSPQVSLVQRESA